MQLANSLKANANTKLKSHPRFYTIHFNAIVCWHAGPIFSLSPAPAHIRFDYFCIRVCKVFNCTLLLWTCELLHKSCYFLGQRWMAIKVKCIACIVPVIGFISDFVIIIIAMMSSLIIANVAVLKRMAQVCATLKF